MDRFHGNGPYGKIPTMKEPIRTLGFTSRLSCHIKIWNNRNIMIDGKPLFYRCWFENNITCVEDLLDNNGIFLSFNQFSEQYQLKTPFTRYFGIISSIPTQWKAEIVKLQTSLQSSNDQSKNSANTISTKTVYSVLLKKKKNLFLPSTAESKILRYGFTQENIHKVYELPFKIKNDIKITMFQYKIIHNILATNVSLFRAKIRDYDICPQCLTDRHTIDHMFLHCSVTSPFWRLFQNWWVSKTKETVTLSNSMILYGSFENMEHIYCLNYALLIAKYSIYNSCLHEKKLCFDSFLALLNEKKIVYNEKLLLQTTKLHYLIKHMEILFFFYILFLLLLACI